MTVWDILWAVLGMLVAATEALALLSRTPGATLSEHVWRVFHVKDGRSGIVVWIGRSLLLTALVWLTGHLGFGWWSL